MRTLLRFVRFHRQPTLGLLQGLLYLEVCESGNASDIELEITTFRTSLLDFFCFELRSFFRKSEKSFVSCVIGSHRSLSQHIAAQASQKFNMCDFVSITQAFIAMAEIACEHWCPYVERHRSQLCVLLTHVWKPAFR